MATVTSSTVNDHPVVPHEGWLAARKALLLKEKELTRLRDELSRERRALPWERVEKPYLFDGPSGQETLADLFEGRSQLVVYHFMFAPDWEEGCPGCSFWADSFDGLGVHLRHRDVTFAAISRAPLAKIDPFKRRMGGAQVDLVGRKRLQLRLSRVVQAGNARRRSRGVQLREVSHEGVGPPGGERVLPGRVGRHLPHVLRVRPRD